MCHASNLHQWRSFDQRELSQRINMAMEMTGLILSLSTNHEIRRLLSLGSPYRQHCDDPSRIVTIRLWKSQPVSIGCDFSPDGRIVSSGSADGKISFYDQFTSRVIRTLEAHSAPCMDVAYHPTVPSCVASCGWNGQVKVWT